MIQELNTKTTASGIFVYVLAYAGWIVTTLIGLGTVFYTRQVLDMAWRVILLNAKIEPAIVTIRVRFYDRVETLILLLLWTGLAFFAEHHYRTSVDAARRRYIKEETARSHQLVSSQNEPRGSLQEWGIDILSRRFLITTSIPVILFIVFFLIEQISLQGMS